MFVETKERNMKKQLFALLIATVAVVGCKKEADLAPEQTVTYKVNCRNCLVYVQDNNANEKQELEAAKHKYFVVSGSWEYKFTNTALDSTTLMVYTGALQMGCQVKASITTSDKKSVSMDEYIGLHPDYTKDFPFDKTIRLKLK